jgi:hypothetical protein
MKTPHFWHNKWINKGPLVFSHILHIKKFAVTDSASNATVWKMHPHVFMVHFQYLYTLGSGPGSVVCIATGYGPDGLGIKSRWGAIFSAPVQTSPGAHPVSCTIGTGSFPGIKSGWGVTLTPHPLLVHGNEMVELYLYTPCGPYGLYRASVPVQGCTLPYLSACTRVHFTYFYCRYFSEAFSFLFNDILFCLSIFIFFSFVLLLSL